MFINKLNQLYKPKRILYYIEATEAELKAFYKGIIPEQLSQYSNAFGTYDYPGVFFISSIEKEVIGIEFRINDPRVEYPENLKSIVLNPSFFYSIEIDEEVTISKCFIQVLFGKIATDNDAHRTYCDLEIKQNPNVIGVFSDYKKIVHILISFTTKIMI